jgi:hypothetical protein
MILDRLMDLTSMQWEDLNPCAMVCSSEGHNSPLIQPFPVSFFEVMWKSNLQSTVNNYRNVSESDIGNLAAYSGDHFGLLVIGHQDTLEWCVDAKFAHFIHFISGLPLFG